MGNNGYSSSEHARFRDPEKAIEAAKKSGQTEQRTLKCPKCGRTFANLPNHLPACGGLGGDDE